jgi:hypothetical protein
MKPRQPFDKNKYLKSNDASPQNAQWLAVYWQYIGLFVNLKILKD